MTTPSSTTSPSPSSPYRNEVDALRERKEALEREIARLGQQTSELEGLRAHQLHLERELQAISQRLGAGRRQLPLLDNLAVASPCSASWDEMLGDDRVRFCLSCEKNVYNVSAMPSDEAERLLAERAGSEICVRFYKRADGTIMTQDCPVGVKKKRRKKAALAVAGAGAMALATAAAFVRGEQCRTTTMGAVAVSPTDEPPHPNPSVDEPSQWSMGDRAQPPVMGSAAPTQPVVPAKPVAPIRPMMGKRAR